MICFICEKPVEEKDKEPSSSPDYPICKACVDQNVRRLATVKAIRETEKLYEAMKPTGSQIDDNRRDGQKRVIEACKKAAREGRIRNSRDLMDTMSRWKSAAAHRRNKAVRDGYGGRAAYFEGAVTACMTMSYLI